MCYVEQVNLINSGTNSDLRCWRKQRALSSLYFKISISSLTPEDAQDSFGMNLHLCSEGVSGWVVLVQWILVDLFGKCWLWWCSEMWHSESTLILCFSTFLGRAWEMTAPKGVLCFLWLCSWCDRAGSSGGEFNCTGGWHMEGAGAAGGSGRPKQRMTFTCRVSTKGCRISWFLFSSPSRLLLFGMYYRVILCTLLTIRKKYLHSKMAEDLP